MYFSAVERIPVSTAVLIEYMAPAATGRVRLGDQPSHPEGGRADRSVVSVAGLVLVVSPGAGDVLDVLGLIFAGLATSAAPSTTWSPRALRTVCRPWPSPRSGCCSVACCWRRRSDPAVAVHDDLRRGVFGTTVAGGSRCSSSACIATGFAYASSITAAEILGSRLSSFVGLLEVVAAAFYAWILLGEALTWLQILGGVLILIGIAFVRSEKQRLVWPASKPHVSTSSSSTLNR